MNQYLNREVPECMNEFRAFPEFAVEAGSVQSSVLFRDGTTSATINWPLDVENNRGQTFSLSQFTGVSDIDFLEFYLTATTALRELVSNQQNITVPSQYTKNVLTALASSEKIPPVEPKTEYSIRSDIWLLPDVEQTVRRALAQNTQFIDIYGPTESIPVYNDRYRTAFSNGVRVASFNDRLDNATVFTEYNPSWPLHISVNNGDFALMPETMSLGVSFLRIGQTEYDFQYDVTHPLVFTMEKESLAPFPFRFAMESNIRKSKAYNEVATGLSPNTDDDIEPPIGGGKPINVTLDKQLSDIELDGTLLYTCMGESIALQDQNPLTEDVIETRISSCTPGNISYQSPSVFSDSISVGSQDEYRLPIYDIGNVSVLTKRYTLTKSVIPTGPVTWGRPLVETPIHPDETITIVFTGIDGTEYSSATTVGVSASGDVQLRPGKYEVGVFSVMNFGDEYSREEYVLEDTERGNFLRSETIPGHTFNDSILMGQSAYNITITSEDIQRDSTTVMLPYLSYNLEDVRTTPDLEVLGKITNYTAFNDTIRPQINS